MTRCFRTCAIARMDQRSEPRARNRRCSAEACSIAPGTAKKSGVGLIRALLIVAYSMLTPIVIKYAHTTNVKIV